MDRVFVTGDTHIPIDVGKLTAKHFIDSRTLTKDDYLIILGDFGLIWTPVPTKEELYWKNWLDTRPWTTLFLDGNHENHHRLKQLPTVSLFGSEVGRYSSSIYHLRRGNIYTIGYKRFFCFGGAHSTDIETRTPGLSWWPEELPSPQEITHGFETIKNDKQVDYVITHTCPEGTEPTNELEERDITRQVLREYNFLLSYKRWLCGHWHIDHDYTIDNKNYSFLYHRIIELI